MDHRASRNGDTGRAWLIRTGDPDVFGVELRAAETLRASRVSVYRRDAMEIIFTKLSDQQHAVRVVRDDGTEESTELESRSFLRHDLAHFAVEQALAIGRGFWGSVAHGAPLSGEGIEGPDAALAETLAGPVQTLMRNEAAVEDYLRVLQRIVPERSARTLAETIHETIRRLRGHWQATPYGDEMRLSWTDGSASAQ